MYDLIHQDSTGAFSLKIPLVHPMIISMVMLNIEPTGHLTNQD